MVKIKYLSDDDWYYINWGHRWKVTGKHSVDLTYTLSDAIRYWLWHCGVPAKIAFWKWKKK
jgi:hypothetical protein